MKGSAWAGTRAMRIAASLLVVLASYADAAKHRKSKSRAPHHAAKVHRSAHPEKVARAATAPVHRVAKTGNPELDRLLEERPAPETWTDSVLTTPAQAVALAMRADSNALPWSGDTPVERLHSVADPYVGTPYRTGGNGDRGFDCSGFVQKVVGTFGITLPGRSSTSYWTQGEAVDEEDLQPGDLVFFSDHTRRIGHVGIYLENGTFVHASVQSGVIVSAIEERYYRRRYKGARRIPALVSVLTGNSGTVASR